MFALTQEMEEDEKRACKYAARSEACLSVLKNTFKDFLFLLWLGTFKLVVVVLFCGKGISHKSSPVILTSEDFFVVLVNN